MSNILLIVEGVKTEKELFEKFYELYSKKNIEIISYGTNIYNMYNKMKKSYLSPVNPEKVDFESLDLMLFLNEYLDLQEELDEKDFTDIILIFDFDPQDPSFSLGILKEMLEHFNDSSDKGKLYINYPMIESFKDYNCFEDTDFLESTVSFDVLTQKVGKKNLYKHQVDKKGFIKKHTDIDKRIGNYLLRSNIEKTEFLLKCKHHEEIYIDLFAHQSIKFESSKEIYILNSSILHMYDEYGYIR